MLENVKLRLMFEVAEGKTVSCSLLILLLNFLLLVPQYSRETPEII